MLGNDSIDYSPIAGENRNLSNEIQESEKLQTIINNLSRELDTLRQQQAESGPANETMNTKVVSESELDTNNIRPRIKLLRKRKILNQTSGSDILTPVYVESGISHGSKFRNLGMMGHWFISHDRPH